MSARTSSAASRSAPTQTGGELVPPRDLGDEGRISREGRIAILAAGLGMFMGAGVLLIYCMGVLLPAIQADTGWSRTSLTATFAPLGLLIGLMSPVLGLLVDRFGPRRVLIASAVFQSVGVALIPLLSISIPMLAVAVVLAGLLGAGQTPVAYSYLVIGWCPERRGFATGIALAFSGLGIAVVPATVAYLIPFFGWRATYLMLALAALAVTLPIAIWLVRDPPLKVERSGSRQVVPGLRLNEAVVTAAFWVLFFAFLFNGVVATAGSISLPAVLTDLGADPRVAGTTMIAVGTAMVVSRVGIGYLLDRVPAVALTACVFCAPVIGHLILSRSSDVSSVVVAATLFGIAAGSEGDALSYLLSRRFGMRDFGKIYGINFCFYALAGSAGPFVLSLAHGYFGEYRSAFIALAIGGGVGVALMASLRTRSLIFK